MLTHIRSSSILHLLTVSAIWSGFIGCSPSPGKQPSSPTLQRTTVAKSLDYKVVHVFVALCDNEHQSIVKVPAAIGDGKVPAQNLYWGCAYGVKSYLQKSPFWQLDAAIENPRPHVLERCVFRHRTDSTLLVADAFDGERIDVCTRMYLRACAGLPTDFFIYNGDSIACTGSADLIAYVGHNGFADFQYRDTISIDSTFPRDALALACYSRNSFLPLIEKGGARPILFTKGFMAPEAYILEAAVEAWRTGQDTSAIQEAAAQAYHKFQKCSLKSAQNLFTTR